MKLTADICDENEDEIDNGSVQFINTFEYYGRRKHISVRLLP